MAYDDIPSERTVTRDRVMRLRDFLKTLPDEKFNMRTAVVTRLNTKCGSPVCMLGWAKRLFQTDAPDLGLEFAERDKLFCPDGWLSAAPGDPRFTTAKAVAVLDHLLATGKVDWSVAT